ncbi:MAG: toll/interleukin-1 receptor domain-containing protein [Bacteroidetes bacterium]|nr:toll/interleukin-1 receptor domain-containing protein [Bacteroidota bacterium]
MEKSKLVEILKNHKEWLRDNHKGERAYLSSADLRGADLRGAILRWAYLINVDLSEADLYDADLCYAALSGANLSHANLSQADLRGTNLYNADLTYADLSEANLSKADLGEANFNNTDLSDTDLSEAYLGSTKFSQSTFCRTNFHSAKLTTTVFTNVDLLELLELKSCKHYARSYVDTHSLLKAGHKLPQVFLRGIGLTDNFIEYLPSLSEAAIQYYSCFISYSNKDELFAKRLNNDLQNEGVRCWFAPEDLKIGDKIRDTIYEAIEIKDKLLVIMSEESVNSDWVEEEVEKALAEEKNQNKLVLFPVRLDDEVMETNRAWAEKIRNDRHIGDFRKWKEPEEYEKAFNGLLRDLKAEKD